MSIAQRAIKSVEFAKDQHTFLSEMKSIAVDVYTDYVSMIRTFTFRDGSAIDVRFTANFRDAGIITSIDFNGDLKDIVSISGL